MMAGKLEGTPQEFNVGRFVLAGEARLFVRELGGGPDVAVLHGGPGANHEYLLPSLGDLSDEFRLHFYDQRGGGRSRVARPSEIGWRDHVADLEALRREWGIERLTMIGYSWGGLLALLYATEHPESVQALALISPAAGWGDYHRRFKDEFARRSRSKEVLRMRAELEASELRQSDPAAYQQRRFDISVAGYFRDARDAIDSAPFVVQLQAQQATWASLKGYGEELRRRVAAVRVPTLILHGRYDPIPVAWAEELAGLLPVARLVVLERSAHVPYVEERERTLSELRRFLREELKG